MKNLFRFKLWLAAVFPLMRLAFQEVLGYVVEGVADRAVYNDAPYLSSVDALNQNSAAVAAQQVDVSFSFHYWQCFRSFWIQNRSRIRRYFRDSSQFNVQEVPPPTNIHVSLAI
jgi:hypothetical protein